ncbi:GTP-binding HSR1-like protein [Candidatus Defluviicoccus seviourii]|uniref:GTP-binding HSR1-like protein n=1 Tax=Candidatus Defluviicoccus seviourii TaxID=2565273 RepID=A0A564WGM6_9PROT|nr:GTP-binding HSR1-like protein [Candidatus Defluviicoccus seviourii]
MSGRGAAGALRVAVVGHTNTGKTSLLRTLTRDVSFGAISDRPGTTRHVEGAVLSVRGASGRELAPVELYDTPGLEDSPRLLESLDRLRSDRRTPWVDVIRAFLEGEEANTLFAQEAKALRQVLLSDVALYVIDARDRVLGKHRDELEILSRCARPVVPVLNFVASPEARTDAWRRQLTEVNMHAIAEFDTVVLNEFTEQRLFEKMLTLLDSFRPTLEALIRERKEERQQLIRAAAELLADLLIDVAAYRLTVAEGDDPKRAAATLQDSVRGREQACVGSLLTLFRFRADDFEADSLPLIGGHWGLDLFNPASLRQFGVRVGGGAAAGGAAGLAIDMMTGGLSLGAAAMLGATIGAVWSSFGTHGRRIAERLMGINELRVEETTLRLLAVRQIALLDALLRRGHASQEKIRLAAAAGKQQKAWAAQPLPVVLEECRPYPDWSRLGGASALDLESDPRRLAARDRLADLIEAAVTAADRLAEVPGAV